MPTLNHKLQSPRTKAAPFPRTSYTRGCGKTIFGYPRDFLDNRFVYLTLSPSTRGLAIGVNVEPVKSPSLPDPDVIADELLGMLELVRSGRLKALPAYRDLPPELLELRHVSLSGDAEPTLSANFAETIAAVRHVRALNDPEFFRVVVVMDAVRFDWEAARDGLRQLTMYDEAWVQFDIGTEAFHELRHGRDRPVKRILKDLGEFGRECPLVVQSLFSLFQGEEPSYSEIEAYLENLQSLLRLGTRIARVQVFSVPSGDVPAERRHLPLRTLMSIAERVETATGLHAEVF